MMIAWDVDNLKCAGCASRIVNKLQRIQGVLSVVVDVDKGLVTFNAPDDRLAEVEQTLLTLGYPRSGTVKGLSAVGADVRSVVSCAIGRLQNDTEGKG